MLGSATMERLGNYLLLQHIGRGGMADVFLARALGYPGKIAFKRILPEIAEESDALHMFVEEANVLGSLRHPNIVELLDIGYADGHHYIAMEYVEGLALSSLLHLEDWRESLHCSIYLAREVAAGLAFAHEYVDPDGRELSIVHRDISPSNILISQDGQVKIADFGIAKSARSQYKSSAGTLKGKFAYMSPEQARGEQLDQRSDIFSLGCVLHELVTGKPLFLASSVQELIELVRSGPQQLATRASHWIPAALEEILARSLAEGRADRYPSAHLMREALTQLLEGKELKCRGEKPAAFDLAMMVKRELREVERHRAASGDRPPLLPIKAISGGVNQLLIDTALECSCPAVTVPRGGAPSSGPAFEHAPTVRGEPIRVGDPDLPDIAAWSPSAQETLPPFAAIPAGGLEPEATKEGMHTAVEELESIRARARCDSSPGIVAISTAIDSEEDIIKTRRAGMNVARQAHLSEADALRLGVVISDLARAVLSFAGHGHIELLALAGSRPGLKIVLSGAGARDGSGAAKTDRSGLNLSIAAVRKLLDEFSMEMNADGGIRITAVKRFR